MERGRSRLGKEEQPPHDGSVVLAYLALGANLGDPEAQLDAAVARLDRSPGVRVRRRARLYVSKPVGPQDQPDFFNTAVEIDTDLAPLDLLDAAQRVELELGRVRGERWGPRVIDVDLALYGDVVWADPRLTLPHPELCRRSFVLQPLRDLCPDHIIPGPPNAPPEARDRSVAAWADAVREPPLVVRTAPDPRR